MVVLRVDFLEPKVFVLEHKLRTLFSRVLSFKVVEGDVDLLVLFLVIDKEFAVLGGTYEKFGHIDLVLLLWPRFFRVDDLT